MLTRRPRKHNIFLELCCSLVPGNLLVPPIFNHESVFLVAIKPQVSGSLQNLAREGGPYRLVETCLGTKCLLGRVASVGNCHRQERHRQTVCVLVATREVCRAGGRLPGSVGRSRFVSVPAPLISWQGCPASLCPKESVRRRAASGICNF